MTDKKSNRGVTRAEWLDMALQSVSAKGIAGLTVQGLARSLGIAKAGFYWHFRDREELLRQLLDYWNHEITEVITQNVELLALEPKSRLVRTAELILENDLTRYEIAIRQWAMEDREAARAVRQTNRMRLDFVRTAFSELGFIATRSGKLQMKEQYLSRGALDEVIAAIGGYLSGHHAAKP